MDQHTFVRDCLAYYEEQGLTPEPGGEWQEAHYPSPRDVGNKTIWMLHDHHQQQGLLQSEEYQRPCFFNADVLRFLTHGPFVPGWFELHDAYDRWSGYYGAVNLAKISRETLVANAEANLTKISRETMVATGKANGKANAPAMNSHINTKKQQKTNAKNTASQRWKCLVTGHVSSPGSLSNYQRARGIDTSLRVRLEGTVLHTL